MRVRVNGVERDVESGTTLDRLVRSLGAEPERGVAVALGGEVVPRSAWERTEIGEGQEVEVLRAVQGG